MGRPVTVNLGGEQVGFDLELVTGLDAWAFHMATDGELEEVLSDLVESDAPAFRSVVVARWLMHRQTSPVDEWRSFEVVAASTLLPFTAEPVGDDSDTAEATQ